jgi:hypothetical protein
MDRRDDPTNLSARRTAMAFLGLCKDDFLVKTLREVFGANPIRVPEERIVPMTVLASNGAKTSFRGSLRPLLRGSPELEIETETSVMANLSGKWSKSVNVDVGLKVLDGFLSGIGIPSAELTAKFAGAKAVSFSFQDVRRLFVDPGVVGAQLAGKVVADENPAASIFFESGGFQFLVIDSTIQSRDFNIRVETKSDNAFALDVPAIKDLVGKVSSSVKVSSSSALDLTFKGQNYLSFAFSCLRLFVDGNGRIASMPPAGHVPGLAAALGADANSTLPTQAQYMPDRVLLSRDPGLVEVEDVKSAP